MGLILVFLTTVAIITGSTYWANYSSRDAGTCAAAAAVISGFLFGCVLLVSIGVSYANYVGLRSSYDATIQQYRQAVTVYADHAKIDVQKASLTDFKYEGYQGNVADFIKSLRRNVVWYNQGLISKQVMKKNWFFGWVIVAPDDDMKVLNMVE